MQNRPRNTLDPEAFPRTDPAADLAVVRAVLAGEEAARTELIDRLACLPAMIRVKHLRMGSPLQAHELDDVVQNVLLAIWQKLGRYDGRVPIVYWVYGFGIVEILKTIERKARRGERTRGDDPDPPAAVHEPAGDLEQLAQALAALGGNERRIVEMKHFEELTFDAIAARLGMVAATVKTRYYRALDRLRRRLSGPHRRGGRR